MNIQERFVENGMARIYERYAYQCWWSKNEKKLRKTAIAFFVAASIASSLSLLKVSKEKIVGFTAVVVGTGLMIALKDEDDLNKKSRDYEYFFNRAQDEFELANYEEAILDYNKALKLSPN